ncbi:hypothetical protein Sru01_12000 [Sphaerisporangium rufum]|uniref:Uncharacterized protein n=1 Tax=Sphaerisporangium rufum TaxID=1381558 RepID=A0A919QYL3_9ACTN|nr:hypothetical protein Sru01_12000 [Sphaerisporangium rufum]
MRWRRFTVVFVPAAAAATGLLTATVTGAIGASFVVAGQEIKQAIREIRARGVEEFGGVVTTKDGTRIPVYIIAGRYVETYDLCQSVLTATPFGDVTIRTLAGRYDHPVTSENQVAKVISIDSHPTYTGLQVGLDASTLDAIPGVAGPPGTVGSQAVSVVNRNVRQVLLALSATTIDLPNTSLRVLKGDHECF